MGGVARMTEAQRAVAEQVVAEESARRRHVVVSLSGSHAYGFPSPDSDLDIKAVHLAPTRDIAGLYPQPAHAARLEVVSGVEVDYTSNELHGVLHGVLTGNGNYIERVLAEARLATDPLHEPLARVVKGALSRKVFRHYHGFATGQLREAQKSEKGVSAKRLLYVLRTTLTGTHLLRTGEVVPDVTTLLEEYGYSHASELIEAKLAGERAPLTSEAATRWVAELERAFASLESAHTNSVLPAEPANVDAVGELLLELRRAYW